MNYAQTIDYMAQALPMYHRIGQAAYKADIKNTQQLMLTLGNPENKFKSIHVAGTNGKGSVSHLLASVLQEAGYKVGLYTSPHLVDFRERIRVNGKPIKKSYVVDFVQNYHIAFEGIGLSFFEMSVGMAFSYFASEEVDVAVIETGMGGRLDSTNVITPQMSIITNIGLDHTQYLGDTLTKIATEKAGIIKPEVPVVIGETHPDTKVVFETKAQQLGCPIDFADKRYKIVSHPVGDPSALTFDVLKNDNILYANLRCPLGGSYQLKNLATLFQALEILPFIGYNINEEQIRQGVGKVVDNTGLQGRWQVLKRNPLIICETAHNADGIAAMQERLKTISYRQLRIIFGCVNDKDYNTVLRLLPPDASFYFTQPSVERALPAKDLAKAAAEAGLKGKAYPSVKEAMKSAQYYAKPDDLILITGSIFLVGDALKLYSAQTEG